MKILKTANYEKLARDKAEDFEVNPWAVCHTTVDKDQDPSKYERCVKKVKQKSRKDDTKDMGIGETKPAGEGEIYTPEMEDEWADKQHGKYHRQGLRPGTGSGQRKTTWDDVLRKMREQKEKEPILY